MKNVDMTLNNVPFSFPLLKSQEIVHCLSEAGIELTELELEEPNRHKDRVKAVFTQLVQLSLGLSEDDLKISTSVLCDRVKSLPFPELHDQTFSDLFFLKSCIRLMKICGLPDDFGWKDLHSPTPKRFRRQLSAAINFVKFREDRLQMYSELHDQRDELLSGLFEVTEEQSSLKSQLKFSIRDAKKRCDEVGMIEKKCSSLEVEITSKNKLQSSIRQESTELKKRANELKDKIATSILAINEMKAEKNILMSKIVKDTKKIIKKLKDSNSLVKLEKKTYERVHNDMCHWRSKLINVLKVENDFMNILSLIRYLKLAMDKRNDTKLELQSVNARILKKVNEIQRLKQYHDNLKHEVHTNVENFGSIYRKSEVKIVSSEYALQREKSELIILEKDEKTNIERIESNEAEARSLLLEIEKENKISQSRIYDIIDVFRNVEYKVIEREKKILSILEKK